MLFYLHVFLLNCPIPWFAIITVYEGGKNPQRCVQLSASTYKKYFGLNKDFKLNPQVRTKPEYPEVEHMNGNLSKKYIENIWILFLILTA